MPQNPWESTPKLKTKNLRLRPIGPQDKDAFFEIFSDEQTLRYWSDAPIRKLDEAAALVQKEIEIAESSSCINWGIALPDSDELIGKFVLFHFSDQNLRAEVGYLLNRRYWGRGFMTEVMQRVLDYSFNTLGLHRLEADTDPRNAASISLLEKFGFEREGFFRERWLVSGKWLNSTMFGLLKHDYKKPGKETS